MSIASLPDWGKGRLSCFHGKMQPPVDDATLCDYIKIAGDIEQFYEAASSRLPLQQIPDLVGCIHAGGLSIGLADPVTNIILNSIALLPRNGEQPLSSQPKEQPPSSQPKACGWYQIATQSYASLCTFMTAYFRRLSSTQARRYLYLAQHDLLAAIKLVHYDRSSSLEYLLPDGGYIKTALRAAAVRAEHPAPDILAGLMTAQYPAQILSHGLAKVRRKKMLSPEDVWEVRDLLDQQWPPNPPHTNIEFRCCSDSVTSTRYQNDRLLFTACLDFEEGIVAEVLVRNVYDDNRQFLSELVFNDREMDSRIYHNLQGRLKQQDGEMEVDYDDHPCEHILTLKMSLINEIYNFYMKALARLPSSTWSARLIRALLVAGHCYGPMDPVSNIILSTIWYDIVFGVDVELPQGILSTKPLSRMASRSLAGLVATIRLTCKSEHEALHHVKTLGFDLPTYLGRVDPESPSTPGTSFNENKLFAIAAKAAKHPQDVAFVSFLESLSGEKLILLRRLLHSHGGRILDADWVMLNDFIREESMRHLVPMSAQKDKEVPRPLFSFASFEMFHPSASLTMSTEMPAFGEKLSFVRTKLNKLLREYCYQHPWELTYQLDIICGVMESSKSSYHGDSKLYHANFLASKGGDTLLPSEATLFFAEFWGPPLSEVVQLKPSSCRPIKNCRYAGRCSVCETEASMILHPPSGGHSGDIKGPIDTYPSEICEASHWHTVDAQGPTICTTQTAAA
ncbi:unnamed protein product [Urochloa humidicola]